MLHGSLNGWRWLVLTGVLLAGCTRGPAGVHAPEWDPAAASQRAFSEYDSNHDGKLSKDELKKCPGLLATLKLFDVDGDGAISEKEIETKLREIHEQQAALVEVTCAVNRGGQPLEGATVTFVPEAFMGDAFGSASGVSGRDGTAFPTVADEDLPKELRGRVHGVHCGVFRVTVTHPHVDIPVKYNTQTELGWVASRRDHATLTINF
jgi:hypothetical protein